MENFVLPIPAALFAFILKYRYGALLLILTFEGALITIIGGALASPDFGVFTLWPLYGVVLLGDFLGDTFMYTVGRFAGKALLRRLGMWRKAKESYETTLNNYFKKSGVSTLVVGKISYGLGWITMLSAGSARMPFPKFLFYCTLVNIIKSTVLIALGYAYGRAYPYLTSYLGKAGALWSTGILILFFLYLFHFRKKN